jgi:hypothetical protein
MQLAIQNLSVVNHTRDNVIIVIVGLMVMQKATFGCELFQLYAHFILGFSFSFSRGRAIAQAVSCRLPTAAARVRTQVRSCWICGEQSGTGEDFLRVLLFPLPILIPPTAPHSSSSIIRGWYNRPNSGRRTKWTQSHPTSRNHISFPLYGV